MKNTILFNMKIKFHCYVVSLKLGFSYGNAMIEL